MQTAIAILIILVLVLCLGEDASLKKNLEKLQSTKTTLQHAKSASVTDAVAAKAEGKRFFKKGLKEVTFNAATGNAHIIRPSIPFSNIKREAGDDTLFDSLKAFFSSYPHFKIVDPEKELKWVKDVMDPQINGWRKTVLQQIYKGIEVHGGILYVMRNEKGEILSVGGTFIPDIKLEVIPKLTANDTLAVLNSKYPNASAIDEPQLVVYRTNMTQGLKGENYLCYSIHMTLENDDNHVTKYIIYLDAHSATILDLVPTNHDAMNRVIRTFPQYVFNYGNFWEEGDQYPTVFGELNDLLNITKLAYTFFKRMVNWDSWDNRGSPMTAIIYYQIKCPNAFWDGGEKLIKVCGGLDRGDVVGHEWGHAYIQGYGGGLDYQYQSGALNEGYADILGETMQQLWNRKQYPKRIDDSCVDTYNNLEWILADDIYASRAFRMRNIDGVAIGLRDMLNPECYEQPRTTDSLYYACGSKDHGGVHTNSGVVNQAYSLLVEGGTSVSGIGLLKAIHIYIRALGMVTRTSTFANHADTLRQACNELETSKVDLIDPVSNTLSGLTISSTDCEQIENVLSLTGMSSHAPCTSNQPPTSPKAPVVYINAFPPSFPAGLNSTTSLTGKGWSAFGDYIWCTYNEEDFEIGQIYVTNSFEYLQCPILGKYPAGTSVNLTVNDFTMKWFIGPYVIEFYEIPKITSVTPSSGPLDGGTVVTIKGTNFVNYDLQGYWVCDPSRNYESDPDCLVCKFGDLKESNVRAKFIDSQTLECITPSWNNLVTYDKMVDVWISLDNYWFHKGGDKFSYTSVTPGNGPSSTSAPNPPYPSVPGTSPQSDDGVPGMSCSVLVLLSGLILVLLN